jgi:polyferredoxin
MSDCMLRMGACEMYQHKHCGACSAILMLTPDGLDPDTGKACLTCGEALCVAHPDQCLDCSGIEIYRGVNCLECLDGAA